MLCIRYGMTCHVLLAFMATFSRCLALNVIKTATVVALSGLSKLQRLKLGPFEIDLDEDARKAATVLVKLLIISLCSCCLEQLGNATHCAV